MRELQAVARDAGHDLPLLVAVDQEGGRVARLREPWTLWPPLRALGRTGSEETCARRMGRGARRRAPRLRHPLRLRARAWTSTRTRRTRSSATARSATTRTWSARLGAALIEGLQEGGVAACAKHFPGHGDTDVDSHLDAAGRGPLALAPGGRGAAARSAAAIEAGVATIMTAHVARARAGRRRCRRRSRRASSTGLLRKELGYDGRHRVRRPRDEGGGRALAAGGGGGARRRRRAATSSRSARAPTRRWRRSRALVRACESERARARGAWTPPSARMRALKERFLLPYRDPDPKRGAPRGRTRRGSGPLARGDRARAAASRRVSVTRPARGRCAPATSSASCAPAGPVDAERLAARGGRARAAGLRGPRRRRRSCERRGFTAGPARRPRSTSCTGSSRTTRWPPSSARAAGRARAACCRASTATCCARTPKLLRGLQRHHAACTSPGAARARERPRADGRARAGGRRRLRPAEPAPRG